MAGYTDWALIFIKQDAQCGVGQHMTNGSQRFPTSNTPIKALAPPIFAMRQTFSQLCNASQSPVLDWQIKREAQLTNGLLGFSKVA